MRNLVSKPPRVVARLTFDCPLETAELLRDVCAGEGQSRGVILGRALAALVRELNELAAMDAEMTRQELRLNTPKGRGNE